MNNFLNAKKISAWFVILLAPLPFLVLYAHHYLGGTEHSIPTGFLSYDMPYYSANGREIFETGNGFAYANPYDAQGNAIYFHWFPWVLGFGIKVLGFEPGAQFAILGILGAFLFSWITYQLVKELLPDHRFRELLFLLAMWGGGFLVVGKITWNLFSGQAILSEPLRFDPGGGYWFLNWGRNLLYTTETLYHIIFTAAWLSFLKKRWGLAIFWAFLLAATHPFSGLQLLLITSGYVFLLIFLKRENLSIKYGLAVLGCLFLFCAYYWGYLPLFPEHRTIQGDWSLKWILPFDSLLLAYGLVGAFAVYRLITESKPWSYQIWLLVISAGISLALAKHDLLIAPRQPLHFTRGYIWMPLYLLALPIFQRLLIAASEKLRRPFFFLLLSVFILVFVSDNAAFILQSVRMKNQSIFLPPCLTKMYSWMDKQDLSGILLLPENAQQNYLAATYTDTVPYLGHVFLTPNYSERVGLVQKWTNNDEGGSWFRVINYIIINRELIQSHPSIQTWQPVHQECSLVLLSRPQLAHLEQVPEINSTFIGHIDYQDGTKIVGWAGIPGLPSSQTQILILLRNTQNVYSIPTLSMKRPDVSKFFQVSELYDATGYQVDFSAYLISPGSYQWGIMALNGPQVSIQWQPEPLVIK